MSQPATPAKSEIETSTIRTISWRLIPFLVLRLGWAGFLAVTGKPRSGATVVRALWSGLRVPLTPGRGA